MDHTFTFEMARISIDIIVASHPLTSSLATSKAVVIIINTTIFFRSQGAKSQQRLEMPTEISIDI
jgi:hypothetical protein